MQNFAASPPLTSTPKHLSRMLLSQDEESYHLRTVLRLVNLHRSPIMCSTVAPTLASVMCQTSPLKNQDRLNFDRGTYSSVVVWICLDSRLFFRTCIVAALSVTISSSAPRETRQDKVTGDYSHNMRHHNQNIGWREAALELFWIIRNYEIKLSY